MNRLIVIRVLNSFFCGRKMQKSAYSHDDVKGQIARLIFATWCKESARTTNLSILAIYIATYGAEVV